MVTMNHVGTEVIFSTGFNELSSTKAACDLEAWNTWNSSLSLSSQPPAVALEAAHYMNEIPDSENANLSFRVRSPNKRLVISS